MQDEAQLPPQPDTPPEAAAPRRRRRWGRWLLLGVVLTLLLLVAASYAALRWLDRPGGHAWLVQQVNQSGVVKLAGIEGSLWRHLTVRGLVVDTEAAKVSIDRVRLDWRPRRLMLRRLLIERLDVGEVRVALKPQPPNKPPTPPPGDLTLPLAVTLDELRLARLLIDGTPVDLKALRAALHSDGARHSLDLQQLKTPRGNATATLQLEGHPPFATRGTLKFGGRIEQYTVASAFDLSGNLRNLAVAGHVDGERMRAKVALRVDAFAPYAYAMLLQARVTAEHIDPAALQAGLPRGDLDLDLELTPTGKGATGKLGVLNHAPGRIDAQRLPFARVDAEFAMGQDWFDLTRASVALPGKAALKARGQFTKDKLQAEIALQDVDLAALHASQLQTALSGTIGLNGPYRAPDVKARIEDARLKASVTADAGWIDPERDRRIALRSLTLARGSSRLAAEGEFGLARQDFKLKAVADHWNPADFARLPAGDISGNVEAQGALLPQLEVALKYALKPGRFNGQPLAGEGRLTVTAQQVREANLWLALGDNRVSATGALGRPQDQLQATLALHNLGQLGQGFGGRLEGNVSARGDWLRPFLRGDLTASGVQTPFGVAAGMARLKAELYPDLDSPFTLDAEAHDIAGFDVQVGRLKLDLKGTRARHHLVLDADGAYAGRKLAAGLTADGGLDEHWNWKGRWTRFTGDGPLAVRLLGPADIRLGPAGVDLTGAHLEAGGSRLEIVQLGWHDGRLQTRGSAPRLVTAEWLALAGGHPELETDLVLAAAWDVRSDAALDGHVALKRLSGDLRRRVGRQVQALDLERLDLRLDAAASHTRVAALAASRRFGELTVDGDTRIDPHQWTVVPGADVNVRVKGELADLSRIAPLLSDSVALAGGLKLDVRRSGPLSDPVFNGTLAGSALDIHDKATGIRLREGDVKLTLTERRVQLDTFRFKGGRGTLSATGSVDLRRDGADAQAVLQAERLLLVNRPDLQLVVTGRGEIKYGLAGLSINGNLRADRGNIEYHGNDVPALSDDVVVVGREPRQPGGGGMKLADLLFDVDLGDNFKFRGYGLEADLSGALRFRASPDQALSASGAVKVDEGTYRAYGQKLDIERGVLSFTGPLDNPSLDILAVRRGGAVEAGVQVKGWAQSPQVSLYSDPNVSDNEKLSWLLFGHGAENMDKGDAAVMVQALNAILTEGNPGEGMTDQFLETLGIDEVGFGSEERAGGTTSQVVTVSKRIGNRLRVGLEKSFDGLSDAISLTVLLSRRWSVVTKFGTDESTLDALYTISFD
ncbi:DUF490 domain-containing protein [Chitiniphilus shinanonensis]|uniref:DUF490 domain-containing protein n=1 Tax=Chitiniphilus shinanonensis TaxID=553088 RepID=A0ABQ6C063_9NEIS|nr:translocation/assembly module TamB domain-containing protein [Chitiniphilus shinanonensis]GLS05568.1 DUF490 domain-containing protein [Chitiniphilus shinanonensis]